jgi:hypothetical protein
MSEKALQIMTHAEFKDGILAGVPKDIIVAHKFGERMLPESDDKQIHDCGIVYYPRHPYLLCVMTRGKDFTSLKSTLATISRVVFTEVEQQLKKVAK